MHFTAVKDKVFMLLHRVVRLSARMPEPVLALGTFALGLFCKAAYLVPGSPVRRTPRDISRVIGDPSPCRVYFRTVDKVMQGIRMYGRLLRSGAGAVSERTDFDEEELARCRRAAAQSGGAIFVVPHCAGSVLTGARMTREFPAVTLARDAKSKKRAGVAAQYLKQLGLEAILVRNTSSVVVARGVLKALRSGKHVFATTDLARRTPDTIEVEVFGQSVWLAEWPSRFAAKFNVPIVPAYPRMENGRIRVSLDEPYLEQDVAASTQRWASCFEKMIRSHPSDWIFMFDKRWSRVLAAAAGSHS